MSRSSIASLLALIALAGCSDSPTGPSYDPGGAVVPGATVSVHLSSGDAGRSYYFTAEADSVYAVIVTPVSGTSSTVVRDSASQITRAFAYNVDASTTDALRATEDYARPAAETDEIRVTPSPAGSAATLSFEVLRVPTAPEHRSAAIALDSTISGESLDDFTDVDRFTFTGVAGTVVEPELTATGPAATDQLACLVLTAPNGSTIEVTMVRPGGAATGLPQGGRVTLPATGQYRAQIASGRNLCSPGGIAQPYAGPYTFRIAPIDLAPESRSDSVAPGDTVSGEAIDQLGDIDQFTLHGLPGHQVAVFLQSLAAGPSGAVQLDVAGRVTGSIPGDTGLGTRTTGRVTIPDSGKLTIRVMGAHDGPLGDTGSYRFYVYPIDPAPEHHAGTIAPGDSVAGEVLDRPGDIDRFTFTGTAGQMVAVDLHGVNYPAGGGISLRVLGPDTTLASTAVLATGDVADSNELYTGRITLPASGPYVVEVKGDTDTNLHDVGGYTFAFYAIDTLPEAAPDSLLLGDSVTAEGLDRLGDVDQYRIDVPDTTGTVIGISLDPAAHAGPVEAALLRVATHDTVWTFGAGYPGTSGATPSLELAPGQYVLVIDGGGATGQGLGHYTLRTSKFVFAPESAPDTLFAGDTVTTEAIDATGDVDVYRFHGVRGQSIDLALEGGAAAGGGYGVEIIYPGDVAPTIMVQSPSAADSLGAHRSNRIDLPATGTYTVRVTGSVGAYTLALLPAPIDPESRPAALAIGDTVTGEAIDAPGDLDQYTLTGTPGQVIQAYFSRTPATGGVALQVVDPATDSVLVTLTGQTTETATGRVKIPAGGQAELRVLEGRNFGAIPCTDALCTGAYSYAGAYTLRTVAIDSAPEIVPAAVVVGDSVLGETISPAGDIDQYQFTGTAGDTLSVYLRTEIPPRVVPGTTLEVIDTATGLAIGSVSVAGAVSAVSAPFVLPYTGQYLIRVEDSNDTSAQGSYEFIVRHGP